MRAKNVEEESENQGRYYDFSFESISKRFSVKFINNQKQQYLIERMFLATVSSIFAHQMFFTLEGRIKIVGGNSNFASKLKYNMNATLRGTEFSIITFVGKVLADYFGICQSEYSKGGVIGCIGYLLNRPLDQIYTVQQTIKSNQNKQVSRAEAFRVILKYDGFKGLYKYENILAPASATIHRSIYFGLYHRLISSSPYKNPLLQFVLFPLLASIGASSSTFLIDKLRSVYLHVHRFNDTAVLKRNSRNLMESMFVTKEILGMIAKGEVKINRNDFMAVSVSICKNWILLALFSLGQTKEVIEVMRGERKGVQG